MLDKRDHLRCHRLDRAVEGTAVDDDLGFVADPLDALDDQVGQADAVSGQPFGPLRVEAFGDQPAGLQELPEPVAGPGVVLRRSVDPGRWCRR